MAEESFFKKSMKIAVPVALQAMLQSSFSMIDQVMVGQLGKTAIAAVEVGGKPGFVFAFVSGAVATVTGIMVSQYMGKEDDEKVDVIYAEAFEVAGMGQAIMNRLLKAAGHHIGYV